MTNSDNKKNIALLKALRDKMNKANRNKNYPAVVEACLDIIALDAHAKSLNIMTCLYYKDLGEAYLKLLEYEKAVDTLKIARDGLIEYRATKPLKFADDWLVELAFIERLIKRTEATHLK